MTESRKADMNSTRRGPARKAPQVDNDNRWEPWSSLVGVEPRRGGRGIGLAVAKWAAEQGYTVLAMLPLKETAGEKKPLERWKYLDFRTPEEIESSGVFNRRCGVAILTGKSRVVVIDLDSQAGEAFLRKIAQGRSMPGTRILQTNKGRHLIFADGGVDYKNQAGQVAEGVDVRGRGGIELIYDPDQPERHFTDLTAPAELPAWLAAELPLADSSATAGDDDDADLDLQRLVAEGIPAGQHEQTMTRLALSLRNQGMDRNNWSLLAMGILNRSGEGIDAAGKRRELFSVDKIMGWWDSADDKVRAEAEEGSRSVLGTVLDRGELPDIPKADPLIEGWLEKNTVAIVPGDTGTNKSFLIIDWGCCLATARKEWLGNAIHNGGKRIPGILVIGEGGGGMDDRISAWEKENGAKVPPKMLTIVHQPASITDPRFWEELQKLALRLGARFVALDTFSSLATDSDEIREVPQILRWMAELAKAINGVVLLAHHTGWSDKTRVRNATQFEQNTDNVVVAIKHKEDDPDSPVRLWRKKNKDGRNGAELWIKRKMVGDSCVLELCDAPASSGGKGGGPKVSSEDIQNEIGFWIKEHGPDTQSEIIKMVYAEQDGVGKHKVEAAFRTMKDDGDLLPLKVKKTIERANGPYKKTVEMWGLRPEWPRIITHRAGQRTGT